MGCWSGRGLERISKISDSTVVFQMRALSFVLSNASQRSETDPTPIHENAYCYPRWDVGGFLGQGLSVNGCYFFSCWAYESTCGNYFYSDGNQYCKCCTYSASPTHRRRGWFVSSKGNDLYQCR